MTHYDGMPTEQELNRDALAAQQRAERFSRAVSQINSRLITEEAANGAFRVTVDMSGALHGVEFDARATKMSMNTAIPMLTSCIQRAQAKITDVARQVLAQELDGDPSASMAIDAFVQRFPQPTPERPAPARARPADEEDWAARPVMRARDW